MKAVLYKPGPGKSGYNSGAVNRALRIRGELKCSTELKEIPAQAALVIKGKAKLQDAGEVIGGILGKITRHLANHMNESVGAPFTRTFSFENGVLEFESGFPVDAKVIGHGEIVRSDLPNTKAVTTVHVGSQEASPAAYEALQAWISQNNKTEAGAPWETYLTDPSTTSESQSRMQIYIPVG